MYAFIEGDITEKNPAYVVLENNGMGYFLHISLQTFSLLKEASHFRLLTHLVVREDAQILYGFATEDERSLFRQLINVSGIGANTARLILSSLTTAEVKQAIITGKVDVLQGVKGIGAKTAQRIIIDLKDKFGKGETSTEFLAIAHNTRKIEALSGLAILGFSKSVVEKTLDKIITATPNGNNLSAEELIKSALKIL
ncbi:MAG: Holliday junction branch migration protein RuvA [Lentimicrobiaceae bacterium]|jgi:Holliday junction DNA helicase RuvA|nr:Holliday junction branch migration protein RuvA [Lentimicrobiaceae bacterium]